MRIGTRIRNGLILAIVLAAGLGVALALAIRFVDVRLDALEATQIQQRHVQRVLVATHAWLRAVDSRRGAGPALADLEQSLEDLLADPRDGDLPADLRQEEEVEGDDVRSLDDAVHELAGEVAAGRAAIGTPRREALENAVLAQIEEIDADEAGEETRAILGARAKLQSTMHVAFVVALAMTVLSMLAAASLHRQVRRGLLALERGTRQVAREGVRAPVEVVGSDEFSDVLRRFNGMLERLRDADASVRAHEIEARRLSRAAGMAHLAAGVLHNLGNCLTSVNTTSAHVTSLAETPRLGRVREVAALLDEHRDHLGEFFATDPRGAKLLPYLERLGEQLAQLHGELVEAADDLRGKVHHCVEIVEAQRNTARQGLVPSEVLTVRELVEFASSVALGPASDGLVPTVGNLDLPPGKGDRHRILQILINLLSNARHAVRDAGVDDPKIEIWAELREGDRISFFVRDNGIGIRPEDHDRVFQFGFTTKVDGNGMGLHASANDAAEMGGRIAVCSEGAGCGARFELQLPWPPVAANDGQPVRIAAPA